MAAVANFDRVLPIAHTTAKDYKTVSLQTLSGNAYLDRWQRARAEAYYLGGAALLGALHLKDAAIAQLQTLKSRSVAATKRQLAELGDRAQALAYAPAVGALAVLALVVDAGRVARGDAGKQPGSALSRWDGEHRDAYISPPSQKPEPTPQPAAHQPSITAEPAISMAAPLLHRPAAVPKLHHAYQPLYRPATPKYRPTYASPDIQAISSHPGIHAPLSTSIRPITVINKPPASEAHRDPVDAMPAWVVDAGVAAGVFTLEQVGLQPVSSHTPVSPVIEHRPQPVNAPSTSPDTDIEAILSQFAAAQLLQSSGVFIRQRLPGRAS